MIMAVRILVVALATFLVTCACSGGLFHSAKRAIIGVKFYARARARARTESAARGYDGHSWWSGEEPGER